MGSNKLHIINPASEEILAELAIDNSETLAAKFKILDSARADWQLKTLSERVAVLQRFQDLLGDEIESLAVILSSEVGKPLQQSRNEVNGARTRIKWLTANAEKYLSGEVMSNENGMLEKIMYEPLGVVCNISAWNYPYLVGVNVFVPALLAGNTIM